MQCFASTSSSVHVSGSSRTSWSEGEPPGVGARVARPMRGRTRSHRRAPVGMSGRIHVAKPPRGPPTTGPAHCRWSQLCRIDWSRLHHPGRWEWVRGGPGSRLHRQPTPRAATQTTPQTESVLPWPIEPRASDSVRRRKPEGEELSSGGRGRIKTQSQAVHGQRSGCC